MALNENRLIWASPSAPPGYLRLVALAECGLLTKREERQYLAMLRRPSGQAPARQRRKRPKRQR